jgi:fluoroacetyl-CoA thioesterase
MGMRDPRIGTTATADFVVGPDDLASALAPDDPLPAVFATPRLVALMELACARLLQPHLAAGQLSAGVRIDATHTAPTPLGLTVTATATYRGREGKLYVFEVIARDPAGEIGRARHTRAIVDAARLEASAAKRTR